MDNKINQHEDINELIAIVHRNEKRRMASMILWIALAFAFGSALTFWAVKENNKSESLDNLLNMQLTEPLLGDTLTTGVHTIHGKFKGKIPENYKFRVFAASFDIYYPMVGEMEISNNGEWIFDNLVLGLSGDIEIVICVLRDDSANKLDERFAKGDYRGVPFTELGKGVLVFQVAKVHVKPQNSNQ